MVIDDQPRAASSGQIGPNPLEEDTYAKVGLRQELEVYSGPHQPCRKAADVDLAALQDGETLSHDGHTPLVEVTKRTLRGFAGDAPMDPITSPMITVAFWCFRRISRNGEPICPGMSTAVATW